MNQLAVSDWKRSGFNALTIGGEEKEEEEKKLLQNDTVASAVCNNIVTASMLTLSVFKRRKSTDVY